MSNPLQPPGLHTKLEQVYGDGQILDYAQRGGEVAVVLKSYQKHYLTVEELERRTRPPAATAESDETNVIPADDLTTIHGIGPATAKKLHAIGIATYRQLHNADTQAIADAVSNAVGEVQQWQAEADIAATKKE